MDIDVILFDWGGTLAHVARQEELFRRGATQAGLVASGGTATDGVRELIALVQRAEEEAARDPELREADLVKLVGGWAARRLGGAPRPERVAEALETMGRAWIGALDPFPGAVEAVRTLRERGYRMGLVSNCMVPPSFAGQELERHGFRAYLDFAIFSSGVGYRKPSPVIYEAALAEAYPDGRPEDLSRVLFVGDSPAFDVMAPAAMGMKTALVRSEPGAWPAEDYARAKPDLTLDAVAELPGWLAPST